MVRGMVAPVKIKVKEVIEHDDGILDTEVVDGDQYVVFNVLFDTGACGSILDKKTWECYKFHNLKSKQMTIKTVMGAKRQEYDRSMLTAMSPNGYKINLETITIGDMGSTKRNSEDYIKAICNEFKWDAQVREHQFRKEIDSKSVDFSLSEDLDSIKNKSKTSFNRLLKTKGIEFAFYSYLERKKTHSKMENLLYTELKMQDHFNSEQVTVMEAQNLFNYRTRMADYSENYRGHMGPKTCPLCKTHLDCQSLSFHCPEAKC